MKRVDIVLQDAIGREPILDNLLELDEALTRLEAEAPDRAKLVKLRYFAGLTVQKPHRQWHFCLDRRETLRFARTWLFTEISENPG